ncbi:MAG: hypothetical protein SWH68_07415 [Thermodesulfobacteriota bacterium]|nr:hypothetical protein [Thermodesulfobacteriota bacterium]
MIGGTGQTIPRPGLKEVPQDIPVIVDHLVYAMEPDRQKRNNAIASFARDMQALQQHSWPGNVRELRNFVKRRLRLGNDESITPIGLIGPADSLCHVPPREPLSLQASGDLSFDFPEITPYTPIPPARSIYAGYIRHVCAQLSRHRIPDRDIAKTLGISVNILKKHRAP